MGEELKKCKKCGKTEKDSDFCDDCVVRLIENVAKRREWVTLILDPDELDKQYGSGNFSFRKFVEKIVIVNECKKTELSYDLTLPYAIEMVKNFMIKDKLEKLEKELTKAETEKKNSFQSLGRIESKIDQLEQDKGQAESIIKETNDKVEKLETELTEFKEKNDFLP